MVVDDNVRLADVSARLLSSIGYDAIPFSNPEDALVALQPNCDFDAILTDLHMPDLTPEEFVLKLRQLCPKMPVIVSTGRPDALDDAALARLGIREVLVKPWRLEEAVGAIERTLASP